VAAEHQRARARRAHRLGDSRDHPTVEAAGTGDVVGDRGAGDRDVIGVDERSELGHHLRDAAGVEEVLHEVRAGRLQVDEDGHLVCQLLKVMKIERNPDPTGQCQQVHHCVGGPRDRGVHPDRILERLPSEHGRRTKAFGDHRDDPLTGTLCGYCPP
jgi:hypothetical protein